MVKQTKLIGEYYEEEMIIKFNNKNIKFIVYVDGVGEVFSITKKKFVELIND